MDWKKTLATVAPTIATALGGPLAGTAIGFLSQWLLGTEEGTEDQLSKLISTANPETLLKLKEADQAFQVKMKELDINLEQIREGGVASARAMQVATKDKAPGRLAGLVTLGFFGLLALLAFREVPIRSQEALLIMLGSLGTGFGQILQFYFGSSKGSEAKTEILRQTMANSK